MASPTVESATAMKAAAVEPTATVEAVAAAEATTAMKSVTSMEAWVPVEPTTAMPAAFATESVMVSMPTAAIVSAPSAVEAAPAIESMEPWTRAYEHSPGKIIRAVVAVRRASVGGIPIVAVAADWSWPEIAWPSVHWRDSNSNSYSNLGMGGSCPCHNNEKSEQDCVL